jgi:hypothetical protein
MALAVSTNTIGKINKRLPAKAARVLCGISGNPPFTTNSIFTAMLSGK